MPSSWAVTKAVSQFISHKNDHAKTSSSGQRQCPTEQPSSAHALAADRVEYADRLKVFIGTWNMYGRLLPIDLATFLTEKNEDTMHSVHNGLDGSATHPYHILVIGTQECERDISESLFYPSKEVWEKRLSDYLGSHYKLVKTETLAALHIAVFVWIPVAYLVRDVQSESIKTGWANMVGNKGAVAISVLFGSRSLLFINCHLTAHQTKLAERNANVHRILYELKMPNFTTGKNKKKPYPSVIDQFDHVFIFGDTNYRINAERPFVFDAIKQGDYNTLLEYDQLSLERRTEGSPLSVFQEHPIQFPPTYKLDTIITSGGTPVAASTTQIALVDSSDSEYNGNATATTVADPKHNNNTVVSLSTSSTSSLQRLASTKQTVKNTIQSTKNKAAVKSIKRRLSGKKKVAVPPEHKMSEHHIYNILLNDDNNDSSENLETPCDSKIALFDSPTTILSYDSSEKQRVPSWTDRILWCDRASTHHIAPPTPKSNKKSKKKKNRLSTVSNTSATTATTTTNTRPPPSTPSKTLNLFPFVGKSARRQFMRDTVCYSYDAVLHDSLLGVSDHMPVIGVFGIYFDEWTVPIHHKIIKLPLKKIPTLQSTHTRQKKSKKKIWWQRLFG